MGHIDIQHLRFNFIHSAMQRIAEPDEKQERFQPLFMNQFRNMRSMARRITPRCGERLDMVMIRMKGPNEPRQASGSSIWDNLLYDILATERIDWLCRHRWECGRVPISGYFERISRGVPSWFDYSSSWIALTVAATWPSWVTPSNIRTTVELLGAVRHFALPYQTYPSLRAIPSVLLFGRTEYRKRNRAFLFLRLVVSSNLTLTPHHPSRWCSYPSRLVFTIPLSLLIQFSFVLSLSLFMIPRSPFCLWSCTVGLCLQKL